ncbi:VOC family protein [Aestuariispira insulae]|uniref:VOC domain-containing protein n=1 Tax=Aestuariispira insulae TaxID=1461337 RepID=A0A3D9H8G2_9PROT|nr:VOC family protein [Aestuariispira insulae]RED45767.1 hypothetical protein DFP90_11114 [Aestuariispira insulae]
MSFKPEHFIVWGELPVTNLEKSIDFYQAVFKTELRIDDTGPQKIAMFVAADGDGGVAGHLYEGKPPASGTGPTLHFIVPDQLEDAMARVTEAGGKVVSDPIGIPPGRFAYAEDLDGNSIGLFVFN